jgi:diguanylate cyclase (GGDEF)-like protein
MNFHDLIFKLLFSIVSGLLGRGTGPLCDWIVKQAARRRVTPKHAARWEQQWLADLQDLPPWQRLLSAIDIFIRGTKLYDPSTSSELEVSKESAVPGDAVYASLLSDPPPYAAPITLVDGLTGLFNRRSFDERLGSAMVSARLRGQPLSVIQIDLDYFKRINGHFGHSVGDNVLRGIAAQMRASLRGIGMIARWGGDEFAVALPNASQLTALNIAEQLRADCERTPISSGDRQFFVTASFGVATLTSLESNNSADNLLSEADEALHSAKRSGRNCAKCCPRN